MEAERRHRRLATPGVRSSLALPRRRPSSHAHGARDLRRQVRAPSRCRLRARAGELTRLGSLRARHSRTRLFEPAPAQFIRVRIYGSDVLSSTYSWPLHGSPIRCYVSRAWSLGMPRGYDDGRRAACLMVPMRAVRARPLVARCDRVELCRRCDLGVCHHLGPAGGLMLKCWVRGWRALVLAILNGAESGLLVQKCA